MVHSWPVAKGVKADLGIWDFFGIFWDFGNPKIQIVNYGIST
jgi:hypothetical protein